MELRLCSEQEITVGGSPGVHPGGESESSVGRKGLINCIIPNIITYY